MEEKRNGDPEGSGPAEGRAEIPVTDRRFSAGEETDAGHRRPPRRSAYPSYVEELQASIAELQAELAGKDEEVLQVRQAHAKAREEQRARVKRLQRDQEQNTNRAVGDPKRRRRDDGSALHSRSRSRSSPWPHRSPSPRHPPVRPLKAGPGTMLCW